MTIQRSPLHWHGIGKVKCNLENGVIVIVLLRWYGSLENAK